MTPPSPSYEACHTVVGSKNALAHHAAHAVQASIFKKQPVPNRQTLASASNFPPYRPTHPSFLGQSTEPPAPPSAPYSQSFPSAFHPSTPSPTTDSDAPHTPGMMDLEMDDLDGPAIQNPFSSSLPASAFTGLQHDVSGSSSLWNSTSTFNSGRVRTPGLALYPGATTGGLPSCVPPSLLSYPIPSRTASPAASARNSPSRSPSSPASNLGSSYDVDSRDQPDSFPASTSFAKPAPPSSIAASAPAPAVVKKSNSTAFKPPLKAAPTTATVAGATAVPMSRAQIQKEKRRKKEEEEDDGARKFRCPIEGCGKVYKQQNGLKYHLQCVSSLVISSRHCFLIASFFRQALHQL